MTIHPQTEAGFTADWQRWRDERLAELHAPDGPPTLRATHWLDDVRRIPGVPGEWMTDPRGDTVLSLAPETEAIVGSDSRTGSVIALVAGDEIGPRIHFPELTAQVTTRLGRRAVRVFDHARADRVADVETFPPALDWVLTASYTPSTPASSSLYGFALESAPREIPVPGVVTFELAGTRYETKPFLDDQQLLLVFADQTTGRQTKPPSRFVLIEPPANLSKPTDGLIVDFNRAFLPPCAFSDEFNCPLPPPPHRFAAAVTAGERWVRTADRSAVERSKDS